MPITMQRLHALLTEHEETVANVRNVASGIQMLIADHYRAAGTPEAIGIDDMLGMLKGIAINLEKMQLSRAHELERALYNRNARRNKRNKDRMTRRRRAQGIEARLPPGAPDEIDHQYQVNREMFGLDHAAPADAPTPTPERPVRHQTLDELDPYAARQLSEKEKFLASLPPPEVKTDEQIAQESIAMLDSIENDDSA